MQIGETKEMEDTFEYPDDEVMILICEWEDEAGCIEAFESLADSLHLEDTEMLT